MKQLKIYVTEDLRRRLKAKAALEGKSLRAIITKLIEQYIEENTDDPESK